MNIQPLAMIGMNNVAAEVIQANLKASFARDYDLMPVSLGSDKGRINIAGAGPSLAKTYWKMEGDVIACNSAQEFLIRKGVIPKYTMLWDASPLISKVFTPHTNVTYLIASRCHPSVFEKLKGYKVQVFHALGDANLAESLVQHGR